MKKIILLLLATAATCHDPSPPINIGILLFPGFQPLDVIGPLDVFNSLGIQRQIRTSFITSNSTLTPITFGPSSLPWFTLANPVGSDTHGGFVPTYTFATAPPLDVLLVPGGIGTRAPAPLLDETIRYVRDVYPSLGYLITVCTGSGIAARAGVLDGKRATTNKLAWAQTIALGPKVRWVAGARWVKDGNIWSSSGVSAGIDVAVAFVAEVYSEAAAVKVTNMLEYERHTNSTDDPFAGLYGLTNEKNSTNLVV
ncbi:class I glutamine amidotransferase-like protein [Rhexocercosporidium sp. MPI-PUGE-AT-0058]|nr:class I glutamine amidotransferase-like protein [Rhexocercosporidium sp. MPI-PUGE-AT-0058]